MGHGGSLPGSHDISEIQQNSLYVTSLGLKWVIDVNQSTELQPISGGLHHSAPAQPPYGYQIGTSSKDHCHVRVPVKQNTVNTYL